MKIENLTKVIYNTFFYLIQYKNTGQKNELINLRYNFKSV